MSKLFAIAAGLIFLASCTFYEPEFRGGESVSIQKIEGKSVKLRAGAKVYNGNGYAIKVKPSTLDVYVNDDYMGKIHLDEKFKMKAKQETQVDAPLTATLADGVLMKIMQMGGGGPITVRLKGKVKAGVWFISKKIDVNESRTLDGLGGLNLKMN